MPLAQGAIDFALSGITSLAEAMAVGSGLEELVDDDAGVLVGAGAGAGVGEPLEDSGVELLLEQRA